MSQQGMGLFARIRGAVAVATTLAMALGIAAPALAADMATFNGAVLNPENAFAPLLKIVASPSQRQR